MDPMGKKMIAIGRHAGFKKLAVIRRAPEGCLGFSLHHAVEIDVFKEGEHDTKENTLLSFGPKDVDLAGEKEPEIPDLSLEKNVDLLKQFSSRGKTDFLPFDHKVKITHDGIQILFTKYFKVFKS